MIDLAGAALAGALVGTLVGVLPGIGPAAAMALLLPLSFGLEPSAAITLLASIYFGSQYGSSTTAILLRIPGEASGVVTAEEGHRMALAGRAGPALAIAALASLVAGLASAGLVWLATPILAGWALTLSSADVAAIVLLACVAVVTVGADSARRTAASLMLGFGIGFVGSDFGGGPPRFTFGLSDLRDGLGLVPLVVGLFGLAELLAAPGSRDRAAAPPSPGSLMPSRAELSCAILSTIRGTAVGSAIGLLPGGSTLLAALAARSVERRFASDRLRYGQGAVSGVAGPEAANNAAAQAGLIPLIGLGLPANPAMAVLMGGFMLHGVPAGALLFTRQPDLFTAIIVGMVLANLMLVVLNLPLIGIWVRILRTPSIWLVPIVVTVSVLGVYAQNRALADVWLLVGFTALGLVLKAAVLPTPPVIFGALLGPLLEDNLRRALLQARGEIVAMADGPVAPVCMAMALVLLLMRIGRRAT